MDAVPFSYTDIQTSNYKMLPQLSSQFQTSLTSNWSYNL